MSAVPAREAAAVLRSGKVALVPTETVVGLVAAEAGLPRIREIKGRDAGKPIALLCSSAEEAFGLAQNVPPLARELADLYWPGPLTLVLDLRNEQTIGVRVPAGRIVRDLLAAYGGPLYATSANPSGEPAPKGLAEVDERVASDVDVVVKGEPGSGEASAVVDLSGGEVRLLRATEELSARKLMSLAEERGLPPGADEPQAQRPAGERFSYRITKNGKIFVRWHGTNGKREIVLKGAKAAKLITDLPEMDPEQQQLALARATGNFKRGNERV